MVKNNIFFSLSLIALFAISLTTRAEEEANCGCTDENAPVVLEQAKSLSMVLEIDKANCTNWQAIAQMTHQMLESFTANCERTQKTEELKTYLKSLYEVGGRISLSQDSEPVKSTEALQEEIDKKFNLDYIVNSDHIKVVCTVERSDEVTEAWRAIVTEVQAIRETLSTASATSAVPEVISHHLGNICDVTYTADDIHGCVFIAIGDTPAEAPSEGTSQE